MFGQGDIIQFAIDWPSYFPDASISFDHFCALGSDKDSYRTSLRWTLNGTHIGYGTYGNLSGRPVSIMGITQTFVHDRKITILKLSTTGLTIPLVRQYIQQFVLVSEDEIAHAIAFAWRAYGQVIEGSAAVALAAVLGGKAALPAVVVISGGNIQPELHAEILARFEATV